VLRPLIALAYVDRVMGSGVLDIFVTAPVVRRALVLTLLFAGGVVDFVLNRVGHVDNSGVLLFAGRIREGGGHMVPRGYR